MTARACRACGEVFGPRNVGGNVPSTCGRPECVRRWAAARKAAQRSKDRALRFVRLVLVELAPLQVDVRELRAFEARLQARKSTSLPRCPLAPELYRGPGAVCGEEHGEGADAWVCELPAEHALGCLRFDAGQGVSRGLFERL